MIQILNKNKCTLDYESIDMQPILFHEQDDFFISSIQAIHGWLGAISGLIPKVSHEQCCLEPRKRSCSRSLLFGMATHDFTNKQTKTLCQGGLARLSYIGPLEV